MKLLKLFFWGFFISLIGSLPLGTLNVATFKISISSGRMSAFWFAFGCVIIEVIYVRISLSAMKWLSRNGKVLKIMTFFIIFITFALAIASFIAAFKSGTDKINQFVLKSTISAFILGMGMSAINPTLIPFWLGFSAVLQSKKILLPLRLHYGIYMISIAIGSLVASFIFIYAGQFLIKGIGNNNFVINIIVGSCFAIATFIQLLSIYLKKRKKNQLPTDKTQLN